MKNQQKARISLKELALALVAVGAMVGFVVASGGCALGMGAIDGAIHGGVEDWDNMTDKMIDNKAKRQRNRYE